MTDETPREDDPTVVRHEEEVAGVEKRWRGAGHVRARKRIETERYRERVPRTVEEVEMRRVPAESGDSGKTETLPDGSISIPVFEEEVVVTKRTVLRERVIIRKETRTVGETVKAELRKERVSVENAEGDVEGKRRGLAAMPPRRGPGAETRPFFLTSEAIAAAALVAAIVVAAFTDAIDTALAGILVAAAVAVYVVSRGFAKARTAAGSTHNNGWR